VRANAVRHIAACAAACALLGAWGCSRAGGGAEAQPAAQAPGERRFPLTGEVLSVDKARKVLTVRHNEVVGYMPAMTMEFAVSAGDAASASPGERIRADLVVGKTGDVRLESIWPDTYVQPEVVKRHIFDLREALGDDSKTPSFLETLPKRGYKFIARFARPSQPPELRRVRSWWVEIANSVNWKVA